MSENTKIEWCDHTFNPWEGCQKVGPGCDNCYAEARNARFGGGVAANWGPGAPRRRTSHANWALPVKWNKRAKIMQNAWDIGVQMHDGDEAACIAAGFIKPQRPKVFCDSLADVFDNAVDPVWRDDLFTLIGNTPHLDWLILTKRIGNAKTMLPWLPGYTGPDGQRTTNVWCNVWLGATIVNQEEADRDIPKLLAVPAHKRFLSMEPLLGDVDLSQWLDIIQYEDGAPWGRRNIGHLHDMLDWVIVGGESGPGARPMHPDWARGLRNQCEAAGVPFLFKQWGEWAPHRAVAGGDEGGDVRRGHVRYLQGDGREPDGHFRKGDAAVARVGKKAAGRLLDGREWNGVPA